MAKPPKLKVYRTTAGFHDAYVAAPSKKAALAAWGTTKDLFARGVADVVEDPALTAGPLASPGVIFKQSRGTEAEQIAALGDTVRPRKAKPQKLERALAVKRAPRPTHAEVKAAARALEETKLRQKAERKTITDRLTQLEKELAALNRSQSREIADLEAALAGQQRAYEKRLQLWRKDAARAADD